MPPVIISLIRKNNLLLFSHVDTPNNITEIFFSESVVINENNTSSFSSKGHALWVAKYTSYVSVMIEVDGPIN